MPAPRAIARRLTPRARCRMPRCARDAELFGYRAGDVLAAHAGGLQLGGAGAGCDFGVLLSSWLLGLAGQSRSPARRYAFDARALRSRAANASRTSGGEPHHFLVQLRQLAAHGDLAVRNRFRPARSRPPPAVRALVEQQRRIERAQALHHGATFGVLAREEAHRNRSAGWQPHWPRTPWPRPWRPAAPPPARPPRGRRARGAAPDRTRPACRRPSSTRSLRLPPRAQPTTTRARR